MTDVIIRNVRVVDPFSGCDQVRDVAIKQGRYVNVCEVPGARELDGRRWIALPGLTDAHVHLREPGQTHKEDIASGTKAAAHGGVVQVAAMPNTKPSLDTPERIRDQLAIARKVASCDVLPIAAATHGLGGVAMTDIEALAQAGAVAVSDDGRPIERADMMRDVMLRARRAGLTVHSHCEDLSLAAGGAMNEGEVSRRMGVKGIPALAEDLMIAREILLAAAYDCPVHICHVSTASGTELVRLAKQRGIPVTAETCPHYFTLTDTCCEGGRTACKMNPPLRTERDRAAIIRGIADGTLDIIVTDHAPHAACDKAGDFERAANGIIGLETLWPLIYSRLVLPGHLSLSDAAAAVTVRPRRILHQPAIPIREGAEASIMLFAADAPFTYDRSTSYSKSRNTPFHGMEMNGPVVLTMWRGRITYERTR